MLEVALKTVRDIDDRLLEKARVTLTVMDLGRQPSIVAALHHRLHDAL